MSIELVKEVMDAETQADTLKKEAAVQAKQIAMDCQKACSALLEKAKAQAKVQRNEALLAADKAADKEREARHAQVAAQCEAIAKVASTKMDCAMDIVIERIVRG